MAVDTSTYRKKTEEQADRWDKSRISTGWILWNRCLTGRGIHTIMGLYTIMRATIPMFGSTSSSKKYLLYVDGKENRRDVHVLRIYSIELALVLE